MMSNSKENIVENNYISLQDASNLCEYSQEYLSLRARQGKLKSVKIGRNWVTKKEWLEEYILRAKENGNGNGKPKIVSSNLRAEMLTNSDIGKTICVPDDLPIGQFSEPIQEFFVKKRNKNFSFVLPLILTCVLLGSAAFFGKASLKSVFADISSYAGKNLATTFEMAGNSEVGQVLKSYFKWVNQSPVGRALGKSQKFIWQNGKEGYKTISSNFGRAKEFVLNLFKPSEIPEPVKEGLVVIPSTEKDAEIKEKIKESFSDEVKVEPADRTSGIVVPVFRTGEGEKYLYILVPIKN